MSAVAARRKRYVAVVSVTDEGGAVTPLAILLDGARYDIERVLDAQRAHARRVGGTGMRYVVRVRGRETCLWYEGPAWFVEQKVAPAAGQAATSAFEGASASWPALDETA